MGNRLHSCWLMSGLRYSEGKKVGTNVTSELMGKGKEKREKEKGKAKEKKNRKEKEEMGEWE